MPKLAPQDPCMTRNASTDKVAGGITVYLLEELGDARLRCAQLKKYIKEATDLIEKSPQKDHFFEVAAHLIHGIPDTLFKLDKALDASALAAARLDYEEIKDNLKPEKADELEDVLQDVRLRYLKRRSGEETVMTPKQAAEMLNLIAEETEKSGKVPLSKVMVLLARIESGPQNKRASADSKKASAAFRQAASDVISSQPPSPAAMANWLRSVIADQMTPTSSQVAAMIYQQASSREDVMKGFKEHNPSMTDDQLEAAADNWEKHKDTIKNKHQG